MVAHYLSAYFEIIIGVQGCECAKMHFIKIYFGSKRTEFNEDLEEKMATYVLSF